MSFYVFGAKPENAIILPDIPYSPRLNCKDGGIFVGGEEPQHRRSNPDDGIEISLLKVSKYFGSLGKTENVMWVQLFYIASPNVPAEIVPPNTVCVSYIKKQSIPALYNQALQVMNTLAYKQVSAEEKDPASGIFVVKFKKQVGANGPYYSLDFDWKERTSDAEKAQWELIRAFMASDPTLIDIDGTRDMRCLDGLSAEQIQDVILQAKQAFFEIEESPKSRSNNRKMITSR